MKSSDTRLSVLERQKFGWTHADAGGFMSTAWKLPEQLTGIIGSHLDVDALLDNFEGQPEKATVALSAFLPVVAHEEWKEREQFLRYFATLFAGKANLHKAVFDKVDSEFEQYARIIQVNKPKISLLSYVEE